MTNPTSIDVIERHEQGRRIADLEHDNQRLRELLHLTLCRLHASTHRERRLMARVRDLTMAAESLRWAA